MGDREIIQENRSIENALVLAPVRPLLTPELAAKDWHVFLELKQKLLDEHDYQLIAGKRFIKKSGFRKLSVVFNLSDEIVEHEKIVREDETFYWRIVTMVTAPNGRTSVGVAICDSRERKFAHPEHDVYATCHTRAKNRGISDMVAGGVVSAEEVEASSSETTHSDAGTDTPVLDRNGIVDALKSAGLDVEDLEISVKEGKTVVKPTKFLGDIWDRFNSALWKLGFSWVSAGKESHWISGE